MVLAPLKSYLAQSRPESEVDVDVLTKPINRVARPEGTPMGVAGLRRQYHALRSTSWRATQVLLGVLRYL